MRSRKRQRLGLVLLAVVLLGGAAALALTAFEDNIVFFRSPSDIAAGKAEQGRLIRVGGLVEVGSLKRIPGSSEVLFSLSDGSASVMVSYKGILPDLFREEQGVVAQGRLQKDGTFDAVEVLAKHDETYMPPEVAEALKKSGYWKDDASAVRDKGYAK
jgi:cytochrome c-type biogenesis protein CcmE